MAVREKPQRSQTIPSQTRQRAYEPYPTRSTHSVDTDGTDAATSLSRHNTHEPKSLEYNEKKRLSDSIRFHIRCIQWDGVGEEVCKVDGLIFQRDVHAL